MRLTGIHMINAPSLANQLMMFLKPLMHKDMYSLVRFVLNLNKAAFFFCKSRQIKTILFQFQISVHSASDMNSVYKSVPKEYFASDLGGNAPSFEALKGTFGRFI